VGEKKIKSIVPKDDNRFCLNVNQILPGLSNYDRIGFLFGAGTSVEAGYPSTKELTRHVINQMTDGERHHIEESLAEVGIVFNWGNGEPDIELLSDSLIKKNIQNKTSLLDGIIDKITLQITKKISSVARPNLGNHIDFLRKLKIKTQGHHSVIWIFTTNYDPLFELAAAEVGINIRNGFVGTLKRHWDENSLRRVEGVINSRRSFELNRELTIILVKLHGSIFWQKCGDKCYESYWSPEERLTPTIVFPRRQKLWDTLAFPFSSLMRYSCDIIGEECTHVISCGFSFRDEHILEHLIRPPLSTKRLRVFAFFGESPDYLDSNLLALPNFNLVTPEKTIIDNITHRIPSESWKFSEFVKLF